MNAGTPHTLAPATIVNLAQLCDFVDDAIVSRTLMKNASGSLTFMALAAGQGISPHSAPFDALVQVLEGHVVIIIDQEAFTLGPQEAILMPANIPHAVEAVQPVKFLLVMLREPKNSES
jgi:quercetin dioxygenase-like cupin family protein